MSLTEKWYRKAVNQLAPLFVELRGRSVGQIPLENLIDVPKVVNKQELAALIKDDGVPAIYWKFSSMPNDDDVIVNIQ